MTYRDERDALRARVEALTAELAEARDKIARLEGPRRDAASAAVEPSPRRDAASAAVEPKRSDRAPRPLAPSAPPGALPSGAWRGFYTYAGQTWRHPTRLVMTFDGARVEGAGDDIVGAFTIAGTFDSETGACSWTKQYRGKHPVEYTATRVANTLTGRWQIPGTPGGSFALWPGEAEEMPAVLESEVARWR